MTATLKFNRKVYVIPEEKYNSMVENRKLRDDAEAEHDSVRLQRPPAKASTSKAGTLNTLSSVADEASGPKTHSHEGGDISAKISRTGRTAESKSKSGMEPKSNGRGGKGNDGGGSSDNREVQEKVIRKTLFSLLEPEKRRNLMKVYSSLFDSHGASAKMAKGLSIPGLHPRDLFLALLHTQCERAARPDDYKALYTRILRNNVPLSYIGNKKLRRVLHYLKNKRSRVVSGRRAAAMSPTRNGTNKKKMKKASWVAI